MAWILKQKNYLKDQKLANFHSGQLYLNRDFVVQMYHKFIGLTILLPEMTIIITQHYLLHDKRP